MGEKHNPYYYPGELGLESVELDELDLNWAFNKMLIVRPKGRAGEVYVAFDQGCSCPTPFEDYEGETQEEVLALMERVRDWEHLQELYRAWTQHPTEKDWARFDPLPRELKSWFEE